MSSTRSTCSRLAAAALPLSLIVFAAPAVSQIPAPAEVSYMTFNVRAPGWNQSRRAQVVGAILQQAPDVLGLHEARPQTNGPELLVDLTATYEPHHTNTNSPIYLKRSRSFNVLAEGVLALPQCSGPLAVQMAWVKVETPEAARFFFYNVHLCVSQAPNGMGDPLGNQAQAIAVTGFMNSNAEVGTAHLLAGDLNASQMSLTMAYLLEAQALTISGTIYNNPIELDDTWSRAPGQGGLPRPGTTTGGSGQTALDWICCNPGVEVLDAEVVQFTIPVGQGANFSDHLPVTATLRLPNVSAYGCGTNPSNSLSVVSGSPAIGSTLTFGVDNPLATQNAPALSFLAVAFAPDPNAPCGTLVAGWGMSGAGAGGELLLDTSGPLFVLVGPAWQGSGLAAPIDLVIPNANLAGLPLYVQGLLVDVSPTPGVVFGLAAAARVIIRL